MELNQNKREQKMACIVLLALTFVQLSSSATSPALASIKASYDGVSATLISMLSTLPNVVGIPATLICGSLVGRKLKYRTAALIGIVIAIVSGVAPFFTNSFGMLLAWRGLFGLGYGILQPLAMPILLGCFQGPGITKQASLNAISINAGGVFFQMFGGILCTNFGWHATFLIYAFMIPALFIVFKCMPEPDVASVNGEKPQMSFGDVAPSLKWALLYGVHMILFFVAVTETSSIVMKSGFGTASAAAIVLSLITGSGMIGGWLYKRMTMLKKKAISIGFVLLALGYFIMAIAPNIIVLSIGAIFNGIGFGIDSMPAFQVYIGKEVPAFARSICASILAIFGNVGGFISRPIVDNIAKAIGSEGGRTSFYICMAGYLFLAVLVFIIVSVRKKDEN